MSKTLAELANDVLAMFEWGTRTNGDRYWSRKDVMTDDWVAEMCRDAHGDMFPDDWRYMFIHDTLVSLSEFDERTAEEWDEDMHEAVDGAVDVYNSELCKWLESHACRSSYVDDATAEMGQPDSVMQSLQMGQYVERREVFSSVLHSLAEHLETLEE